MVKAASCGPLGCTGGVGLCQSAGSAAHRGAAVAVAALVTPLVVVVVALPPRGARLRSSRSAAAAAGDLAGGTRALARAWKEFPSVWLLAGPRRTGGRAGGEAAVVWCGLSARRSGGWWGCSTAGRQGREVYGCKVLGRIDDLPRVADEFRVRHATIICDARRASTRCGVRWPACVRAGVKSLDRARGSMM